MTIILSFSNTSNLTARRFNSHRQSHQKQHDTSQRNPYIVRWSILFPDAVHSIYTLPVTFYRHDMSCLIQRWIGNTLTHPSNRHMPVQTSEHSIIFRLQRRKRIDLLWLCNVFSCIWFYSDGCKYREKTESRLKNRINSLRQDIFKPSSNRFSYFNYLSSQKFHKRIRFHKNMYLYTL